jgi:hypothetical protein
MPTACSSPSSPAKRGITPDGALTEEEEAAAVNELRALAGGRADLLAQVAGIFEGTSEGELDEPFARSAARLCRLAGAEETLISA